MDMSKVILRIFLGLIAASLLFLANKYLFPADLTQNESFETLISVGYLACIVIPCAIYFLRNPPGTNNKGERP